MFLALEEFESLLEFLEHVSLVVDTNDDPNQEYVSIMTLHAAKGLEFDVVFLSGWEEGIFPHQRAISEEGKKGLEEERRLAYVGITRARKRLFISYAANRRVYGKYQSSIPSRFIKELPDDHVQVMDFGHGLMPSPSTQDESLSYRSSYPQQRMKAKSSDSYNISRSESFSASKKTTSSNATSRYPFPIGTRVQHVKFGRGKVIGCETDKVSVAFDDGSIRKIMSDFISAAS
jgi:DNA helicase-2/ATP-dependent DNA helicase PcrA